MDIDTKSLDDLKHPDWNPRRISEFDFNNLKQSIKEFGDLSGVVKNIASGNIVGGNQRVEAFKALGSDRMVITYRMGDGPTRTGTIALGYVVMPDGEQFGYREVLWPLDATDANGNQYSSKEKAANVAANHVAGEDNKELLAQLDYELSQLENGDELLALTGQTEDEVTKLLQSVGAGPEPEEPEDEPDEPKDNGKVTFALSPDQKELVDRALSQAKADYAIPHTNLDNINGTALYYICSEYLQNHASQNIEPNTPTESTEPVAPPTPETDATLLDTIPTIPTIPTTPGTNAA